MLLKISQNPRNALKLIQRLFKNPPDKKIKISFLTRLKFCEKGTFLIFKEK